MKIHWIAAATLPLFAGCVFSFDRSITPGDIRGTVVFAGTGTSTTPVIGAHVVLENSPVSVDTDAHGQFVITGLGPGVYGLDISASQARNGTDDSGLRLEGITLDPGSTGLGDGRDLGQIVIGAFGGITGTVTAVPEGSTVTAILSGIEQMSVTESGYTFKNVAPGDYTVSAVAVSPGGVVTVSPSLNVHVTTNETTSVAPLDFSQAMPATLGSIQGLAILTGVASSGGVSITLSSPGVMASAFPVISTDDSGDYTAVEIPAGIYTVTAGIGGYESVSVPSIVVGVGTTLVPTITLAPAGSPSTDAPEITQACENVVACKALSPVFATDAACAQTLSTVLSGLEAIPACAAAVDALRGLDDCLATSTCTALETPGACSVPAADVSTAANADPQCSRIVSPLFGHTPTDGGTPDAGADDAGPPVAGADAGGSDGGVDAGGMTVDGGVDGGPATTDGGIPSDGWTLLHAQPSVRLGPALVFDSSQNRLLAVGGTTGAQGSNWQVSDGVVWVWPLSAATPAWQRLAPQGSESAFDWSGAVIFDTANDRLVVYSSSSDGSGASGVAEIDLVTFDSSGDAIWTVATTGGTAPIFRTGETFTYDPINQRAYLFGGLPATVAAMPTVTNEVWSLSLPATGTLTWQNLSPATGTVPPARQYAACAVSPRDGSFVMTGGDDGMGGSLTDTYTFTSSLTGPGSWTAVASAAFPEPTAQSMAAYVTGATAAADTVLVFDSSQSTSNQDVFSVNIGASTPVWTDVTSTAGFAPDARTGAGFAVVQSALGAAPTAYAFAGQDPSTNLNDLWQLTSISTGGTWARLAQSQDEWYGASAIAEPTTGNVYLWGGMNESSSATLNDLLSISMQTSASPWVPTSQPAAPKPADRTGAATVYDSNNARMVIFGGDLGLGDLWTIDPAHFPPSWVELSDGLADSPGPSPTRSLVSSAYDPGNQQLIVFGGAVDTGSGPGATPTFLNETWVLPLPHGVTTATWSKLPVTAPPAARAGAMATFDTVGHRLIVIGGYGSSGTVGDVWELALVNGNAAASWSEIATANVDSTNPFPGLEQAGAVFDASRNRVIIAGGGSGGLGSNVSLFSHELWSLDLTQSPAQWTALCPAGTLQPPARLNPVFLPLPSELFFYGGFIDTPDNSNGLDNSQYVLPYIGVPACTPGSM